MCILQVAFCIFVFCKVLMAEEPLQLGDQSTADIKLLLMGSDETEYEGNPLYLHSKVLRKSEFYETLLSERWSAADKLPIEIHITSPHSNEDYIKCIQLMYSTQQGNPFCFSNVAEVQAILPVASQLLFHACVKECMLYLDAVRWSPHQEAKLRSADEYSARLCTQVQQWANNDALSSPRSQPPVSR